MVREEMDPKQEVKDWIEGWKGKDRDPEDLEDFWDSRAKEFNEKVPEKPCGNSEVVNLLKEKGYLTEKMEVLDIGSGPGKHTLALACEVKRVVAMDISQKMLKELENNVQSMGYRNVESLKANWQEVDLSERGWEKNFDLVFASMSPGIDNYEDLDKMIRASRKYCYLSGFVRKEDLVGDEIEEQLQKKYPKKKHRGDKVYYVFNILYKLGYFPEVTYQHRSWEKEWTLEDAKEHYRKKFSMGYALDRQDLKGLEEILEKHQRNGRVREKSKVTKGILTWKVFAK